MLGFLSHRPNSILHGRFNGSAPGYAPESTSKPPDSRVLRRIMEESNFEDLQRRGGVEQIARCLNTDLERGIQDDLAARVAAYGGNIYPRRTKSFSLFLRESCPRTLIVQLLAAAVMLAVESLDSNSPLHGWHYPAGIGLMALLHIVLSAACKFAQCAKFHQLKQQKEKEGSMVQVKRRGRISSIPSEEVVVGDIVCLSSGDQVPADGLFLCGVPQLDESWRTGEVQPLTKNLEHPFLYAGSVVVDGWATMLVITVGVNTRWNHRITTPVLWENEEKTPFQILLDEHCAYWGRIARLMTIPFLVLFSLIYLATEYKPGATQLVTLAFRGLGILNLVLAMFAVAVPGGLHAPLSLIEHSCVLKMMGSNILVKKLASCYTFGSVSVICSAKTGVLTHNQMHVESSWVAGRVKHAEEVRSSLDLASCRLREAIALGTEGSVEPDVPANPTERALFNWGLSIGMSPRVVHSTATILQVRMFNSSDKLSAVTAQIGHGTVRVYWKGAAEDLLRRSKYWMNDHGTSPHLTEGKVLEIKQAIERMGCQGRRCVAFAFRDLNAQWQAGLQHIPEYDLTFLAVVGITDPCRLEARGEVGVCRAAGLRVIMMTGDSIGAARAKAQECAILTTQENAIEAGELQDYGPQERRDSLQTLEVVARMTPEHKLLLVRTLQQMGEVVAITGAAVDDSCALLAADVGMGLALAGTHAVKATSDVIILDDNFASIVDAVRWGRTLHSCVQNFLWFQSTSSCVALVVNFLAAISNNDVPLNAVKLLWVSLVVGTLGALALSLEPIDYDLMQQHPRQRHPALHTPVMVRDILGVGLYQIAVLWVAVSYFSQILVLQGSISEENSAKNTFVFNSYVLGLVANLFNARKPSRLNVFTGIWKSPKFLMIVLGVMLCQVVIVQFGEAFTQTNSLTWKQWLASALIGLSNLFMASVLKVFLHVDGQNRHAAHKHVQVEEALEVLNPLLSNQV